MRLRFMHFVVFPTKALLKVTLCGLAEWIQVLYLSDAKSTPFLFPKKLQCVVVGIKVFFRYDLQHRLRELDMSVFVFIVRISG